ncbi:MAG: S8 family serine peptidase [Chitinophagaceae bacterium]
MKKLYLLLLAVASSFMPVLAQKLPAIGLKSGTISGSDNLLLRDTASATGLRSNTPSKRYLLLQFNELPTPALKQQLAAAGVQLYDYVPGNAFFAEVQSNQPLSNLKQYSVAGAYNVGTANKISPELKAVTNPSQQQTIGFSYFGSITRDEVMQAVTQAGASPASTRIQPANTIFVTATPDVIQRIAALPYVSFIASQALKDEPLNYNNQAAHGIHALSAPQTRNLQGRNVTVGMGDNSDPSTHIDISPRLINRAAVAPVNHGTHTTGTVGGGGIINPLYKGMAPQSTLLSQYFSDILVNAPVYITDYNMPLTNNSYTSSAAGCPGNGEYDFLSYYADVQLNTYPNLLHVFAAGNDGAYTCSPYTNMSFATVKSGFQSSKNVLTVGNLNNTNNYTIGPTSSRGPVKDGRVKPEIVAGGVAIISTYTNNNYVGSTGTSMACPTVTGSLALLVERYRQLHGGVNPEGALLKAIAANSADDLGNPGPDYTFGFGMLNARKAVEMMENGRYFVNNINHNGTNTYTITNVPAGIHQLKVMLYWSDYAANPGTATTLVNNLDLTVTTPTSDIHYPLILNPSAATVTTPAVEGVDNKNNMEQVVINNPPAGDFTITVRGTNIPFGPQHYIVTYEIINPNVTVEYPFGNETWVPGETETIRWSAYGGDANTFTIEYSTDNGVNWTVISNSVPSTSRTYAWVVPSTVTATALIRVTRNTSGYFDQSDFPFSILGAPTLTATATCPGYVQLNWTAVTGATGYEIMRLNGDTMQTIATTAGTTYLLQALNPYTSYWLAVRAVNGTVPGRRSLAQNIVPNGGDCTDAAFDNDFTIDSLLAPGTGRMFTSSQLGNQSIRVNIRNRGNIASSGSFIASYQVNNGTIVNENSSQVINNASSYAFTFATPFNFSTPGTYTIKTWVTYVSDTKHQNDTLVTVIKNLQNTPLTLTPSFTESFETGTSQSYTSSVMGFDGLDRCDFVTTNTNSRVRTFVNSGFARTGNRSITLDQPKLSAVATADSLICTFNLSNYSAADQLWFDFYYRNQGVDFVLPGNQVWIRGNENAAWIPVFTLPANVNDFGIYRTAPSIDITGVLSSAVPAQTISSSFQVKFGQQGYTSANSSIPDGNLDDGYTFDDIVITRSSNDVGLMSLVAPVTSSICQLTNNEQVRINIKNYSLSSLNNVFASYKLNGATVTENIGTILAGETKTFTFTAKANLSAFQTYTLRTWINYSGDNYRNNDSLPEVTFTTTPMISTFPYLEKFETNNGYWYTGGLNSSWQWGTPTKTIINKTASGTKAWVTSLTGTYNNSELSYLYSPCFNISTLAQPVFSFSHIFSTEDNCDCDRHWVEYSLDDINWTRLGSTGSGTNWYDYAAMQVWKISKPTWQVASIDIPVNPSKIRFRIVMYSDPGTTFEGVGVDDIHIFDKAAIYSGTDVTGITQTVNGTGWINFTAGIGNNRVVSINPNGQNLGSTTVKAYFNTGAVRYNNNQYYLDRNIVIQPTNAPIGNVTVRYYFLNAEMNTLLNATGCGTCTTPVDAYAAGITQYSNAPAEENGTLSDNSTGTYRFILPRTEVSVVPYDNGYYAEFQVSNFSEFWINGGGAGGNQPLPLTFDYFTAVRQQNTAVLLWKTLQENNTDRYVIEKSNDAVHYTAIGEVMAAGNSNTATTYQFTDKQLQPVNYYRLKMLDKDAQFTYSPVRRVNGDDKGLVVTLYPNPAAPRSQVTITTSANSYRVEIADVSGRMLKAFTVQGTQYQVPVLGLTAGTYLLNIYTDGGKKVEKLVVK